MPPAFRRSPWGGTAGGTDRRGSHPTPLAPSSSGLNKACQKAIETATLTKSEDTEKVKAMLEKQTQETERKQENRKTQDEANKSRKEEEEEELKRLKEDEEEFQSAMEDPDDPFGYGGGFDEW